jgi:SAM-dependent methyltransferase
VTSRELPLPPLELRELVGGHEPEFFDNPTGAPIFPGLAPAAWDTYLDFGCGCGRSARRLIQQDPRPRRYIGVDLHRGMVHWCQEHLAPRADGFEFLHHDVHSPCLNPDPLLAWVAPLPVEDGICTLIEATSVFTHLVEGQAEHYLDEMTRVLAPEGRLTSTWFLFEKDSFPYMQDSQNALYINIDDPTNAVAYDRTWLQAALAHRGLRVVHALAPTVRGFHWRLDIMRAAAGVPAVEIPQDTAPVGRHPPPLLRAGAERFGLDGDRDAVAPAGPTPPRARPPQPSHLAIELQGAKRYIASLEAALGTARRGG